MARHFAETPEHWTHILLPFESHVPEKYYSEDVYQLAARILRRAFDDEADYFTACSAFFSGEIDSAYAGYERAVRALRALPSKDVNRETRFREHVFPLYLELIEGVWRPLARFFLVALERPPEKGFPRYARYRLSEIKNKLAKPEGQWELTEGWNRMLRNSIAHQTCYFPDDVHKDDVVVLRDGSSASMVEQEVSDCQIDIWLDDLCDTCSAMLYAILRYYAAWEVKDGSVRVGHYVRNRILTSAIEDKNVRILSNTICKYDDGEQRNLSILYDRPCDIRAVSFTLHVLELAVHFLPSNKYLIAVGKRDGLSYLWLTTTHARAMSFLNGSLSLLDYFMTDDFQVMSKGRRIYRIPRFPPRLRGIRHIIALGHIIAKREWQYLRGWHVVQDRDFSYGATGRYELTVVLRKEMSRNEVRDIVRKLVRRKRSQQKRGFARLWHLVRTLLRKHPYPRPRAKVVLVQVWEKEKRPSVMNVNPDKGDPLCVCCAEWNTDEHFTWIARSMSDEHVDGIVLRWFNGVRGGS